MNLRPSSNWLTDPRCPQILLRQLAWLTGLLVFTVLASSFALSLVFTTALRGGLSRSSAGIPVIPEMAFGIALTAMISAALWGLHKLGRQFRHFQETVRESDHRTRQILDGMFGFVGLFSVDGILLEANEAPLQAAGLKRDEVVGQPFWETYWWNYDPQLQTQLRDVLRKAAEGQMVRFEPQVRVRGGDLITIDAMFGPLRNARGQLTHLLGFAVDITDRKRVERALQKTEKKYRKLFDQSPSSIVILDPDSLEFVEFNAFACRQLGYSPEEFSSLRLFDIEAAQNAEEIRCRVQRLLEDGHARFETLHRTKQGELRNVVVTSNVIELDGKNYLQSIFEDITARKRAEQAFQESEQRFKQLVDSIPLGVGVVDKSGQIVFANHGWLSQFGYAAEELFGQTIEVLVPERFQAGHPHLRQAYQRAPQTRPMGRGRDLHGLRKNGSEFPVEIALQPFQFCQDGMTLVVVTDITERKLQEEARKSLESQAALLREQLAHASRVATMGEMAAGIAHELNQPLAALNLYAEGLCNLITREGLSSGQLSERLTEISHLALRCGQIIRRLKQFASKKQLPSAPIDVRELVHAVVQFLGHELRALETTCSIHLADGPLQVSADALEIQQVLINLVRNAIEAQAQSSPENRLIDIAARRTSADQIEISVSDRGPGVTPADEGHLFEAFYTTKNSGLGLGLKISQTIIQARGGDIRYQRRLEGGATFLVLLPAAKESA